VKQMILEQHAITRSCQELVLNIDSSRGLCYLLDVHHVH